jgi:pyridoxal phosphate enzyme (YggS family)
MDKLKQNLFSVHERIHSAASRAGRNPADVTLVAVTKTQPPETILQAYELGLDDFGENRVEEAEGKVHLLPAGINWHMIGHIQGRKAKRIPGLFRAVHSVDSLRLARRLDRACQSFEEVLPVFVECNVSGEISKYGFAAHRWDDDEETRQHLEAEIRQIAALPHLRVRGLMTMAPIVSDPENARPVFVKLRQLRDSLAAKVPEASWEHLSMGMTDDFEVAIEEGATHIRVGRAIFSPSQSPWRKG